MILVLGTGRSGTSTIARLLHENLKINMGSRFRSDETNPQGFYEDLEIKNLNIELLEDGRWGKEKIHNLLALKKEPFGIKDPRVCNLWQVYKQIINKDTKIIVTIRDANQVIRSMIRWYNWSEVYCRNLIAARLFGINQLLIGKSALLIDFSIKRKDEELTQLLSNFLRKNNEDKSSSN